MRVMECRAKADVTNANPVSAVRRGVSFASIAAAAIVVAGVAGVRAASKPTPTP